MAIAIYHSSKLTTPLLEKVLARLSGVEINLVSASPSGVADTAVHFEYRIANPVGVVYLAYAVRDLGQGPEPALILAAPSRYWGMLGPPPQIQQLLTDIQHAFHSAGLPLRQVD